MTKPTLARQVGLMLLMKKAESPLPRNRAEARKLLRGKGPWMLRRTHFRKSLD